MSEGGTRNGFHATSQVANGNLSVCSYGSRELLEYTTRLSISGGRAGSGVRPKAYLYITRFGLGKDYGVGLGNGYMVLNHGKNVWCGFVG